MIFGKKTKDAYNIMARNLDVNQCQNIRCAKAEGREFAKILRSLGQFIQTVKGQNNFW